MIVFGALAMTGGPAVAAGELSNVLRQIDLVHGRAGERVQAKFAQAGLSGFPQQLLIRVFKSEGDLEVWGRAADESRFRHVHTYPVAPLPRSGLEQSDQTWLGPKQQSGDYRVPEGFYWLLYHNPWSQFHLSLAVGYPNPADAIRGWRSGIISEAAKKDVLRWWRANRAEISTTLRSGHPAIWGGPSGALGNQIFIHGGSATIGCIPVGDPAIEELFIMTDARRVGGTQIHIFPCRLTNPDLDLVLESIGQDHPATLAFWRTLEPALVHFDNHRTLPSVHVVPETGAYIIGPSARDDLIDF